ncbi:MAG: hypothetical protein KJS91_16670, partial [Planctomycetes bacterium]|nr:hypothetical protein [Planctomycetota bacterium]
MRTYVSSALGFFSKCRLIERLGQFRNRKVGRKAQRRPSLAHLQFEVLEQRLAPAILAEYPDSDVDSDNSNYVLNLCGSGQINSKIYISTDSSGYIRWSEDGTNWTDKSNDGYRRKAGDDRDLLVQLFYVDTVYVGNFVGLGKNISIQTSPVGATPLALLGLGAADAYIPIDVTVNGNILTNGGGLAIRNPITGGLNSITINDGVTISTRKIDATPTFTPSDATLIGRHASASVASTGNSGNITLGVANADPYNPILNYGFNHPRIAVGANSRLLADTGGAASSIKGGDISLQAKNYNLSIKSLWFNDLGLTKREAALTVGDSAAIRGANITMYCMAGDLPILEEIGNAMFGEDSVGASAASSIMTLMLDQLSDSLPFTSLPVALVARMAETNLSIGSSANISATDDIKITTSAVAEAEAAAKNWFKVPVLNTPVPKILQGLAFAFGWGQSTSNLIIGPSTISAGGEVEIESSGTAKAAPEASYEREDPEVDKTTGDKIYSNGADYRFVATAGVVKQDVLARVDQGATISGSTVSIKSSGENGASNKSLIQNDRKGNDGTVSINFSITNANVTTDVRGTVTATGAAAFTGQYTGTFSPKTAVNTATDEIALPSHGLSTGVQLAYSAGDGGLVPGLLEGTTYYVIKVDNDRIRLAATHSDAMAGQAID